MRRPRRYATPGYAGRMRTATSSVQECVDQAQNAVFTADVEPGIDVVERSGEIGSYLIPDTYSRGHEFRQRAVLERLPIWLVNGAVVTPGDYDRTRRNHGDQLRIFREHVAPDEYRSTVAPEQVRYAEEVLEIQLRRGHRIAGACDGGFRGLIESDMEEGDREKRARSCSIQVCNNATALAFCGSRSSAVRNNSEVRVAFDPEQIVKVAVEFHTRDHVYMAPASERDDAPQFLPGEPGLGVNFGKSLELNGGFPSRGNIGSDLKLARRSI